MSYEEEDTCHMRRRMHVSATLKGVGHDGSSGGCDVQYLYNIYKRQV
jgi:hypothetical protein